MTGADARLERLAIIRDWAHSGKARAIREEAHLHRADIARAVGVSASTVSRWESGDRLPAGERALAYGALLDRLARRSLLPLAE